MMIVGNNYLTIFIHGGNKISVKTKEEDRGFFRSTITGQIDKSFLGHFKGDWQETHYIPEGGILKQLFSKGDVDKSRVKRRFKKGMDISEEKLLVALKDIKNIAHEETKVTGNLITIIFTYNAVYLYYLRLFLQRSRAFSYVRSNNGISRHLSVIVTSSFVSSSS